MVTIKYQLDNILTLLILSVKNKFLEIFLCLLKYLIVKKETIQKELSLSAIIHIS